MKTLAVLLATAAIAAAQCCQSVPCPAELGDCNRCVMADGVVVALTRKVCGPYTYEKCKAVFNGNEGGLADDGCNDCKCGKEVGPICTVKGCPPYDRDRCIKDNGGVTFDCQGSTCHCTVCGLGFSDGK